MPALIVQAAELLKTAIAAHSFDVEFTPARRYADFEIPLKELDTTRVDVVVVKHDSADLEDRGSAAFDLVFAVGIRHRFDFDDTDGDGMVPNEKIDPLVKLVEDMHAFLSGESARLLGTIAAWKDTRILLTYSAKQLHQHKQFTGLLHVFYETEMESDDA